MKKHFNIRLEETLIQAFKNQAQQNRTTPTALITQWIEDYCNDATTTSDDKPSDPDRTYSNDKVTTNQLKSAIASLENRINQLENDSNDKVTTDDLDQRLAEALEPIWKTLDNFSVSKDTATTSDDTRNQPNSDDRITTSNDNQESNLQDVTTNDYSKDKATTSDDLATTGEPGISNDSDDARTTDSLKNGVPTATTNDDTNTNSLAEQENEGVGAADSVSDQSTANSDENESPESELIEQPYDQSEAEKTPPETHGPIAPEESNDPIANSLPSPISGNKLAAAYGVGASTLRGWLKKPPKQGESKEKWDKIQRNWKLGSDKKWHKR